jgi:mono/diheme cytochrome c family protein
VSLPAGRDIYQTGCWVCHGREGDGQGPAAATLKEKRPRDFTDPQFVIEGREEEVERVVALGPAAAFHGSSFMPEWASRLSPQQIRDVVEYLKTFQKTGSDPSGAEAR